MNFVDCFSDAVALILNPVALLVYLVIIKNFRKIRRKSDNPLWSGHQGRGV
jgi:hypothetical protein